MPEKISISFWRKLFGGYLQMSDCRKDWLYILIIGEIVWRSIQNKRTHLLNLREFIWIYWRKLRIGSVALKAQRLFIVKNIVATVSLFAVQPRARYMDQVLHNGKEVLRESELPRKTRARRDLKIGTALGRRSGIHRKATSKETSRKHQALQTIATQTEGSEESKLRRQQITGDCQHCAWPWERKRCAETIDCFRWKRLVKGTAPFPTNTRYKKD